MASESRNQTYTRAIASVSVVLVVFAFWIGALPSGNLLSSLGLDQLQVVSSCGKARPCLDLSTGLMILDLHIGHLSGIWDRVEAMGQPAPGFVPTCYRLADPDYYPERSYDDPTTADLIHRMVAFALKANNLDSMIKFTASDAMVDSLDAEQLSQLGPVLTRLGKLHSRSAFNLESKTDKILNSTADLVVGQILMACERIIWEVTPQLPAVLNTSLAGVEVVSALDLEYVRVTDTLNDIPWWDGWTRKHRAGASPTARYREWLNFLKKEDEAFRFLTETASALNENLVDVRDYCTWYSAKYSTPLMLEDLGGRTNNVSVKSILQDVDGLLNRIKLTRAAGRIPDVPGYPARRVQSRTTPWLL
ncbi:hypothetical protein C8R43DRAFT_209829 [Mycena crocata]|nr:hypothetical protein C8R43DRAFT_209829 [Mycena crocata]